MTLTPKSIKMILIYKSEQLKPIYFIGAYFFLLSVKIHLGSFGWSFCKKKEKIHVDFHLGPMNYIERGREFHLFSLFHQNHAMPWCVCKLEMFYLNYSRHWHSKDLGFNAFVNWGFRYRRLGIFLLIGLGFRIFEGQDF